MNDLKLLFVYEDEFNACAMKKLFKDTPFKIVEATNDCEKAIVLIEKLQPDVVVCGIAIRGVDGLAVIKKAASLNNNCKIMVLSAINDDRIIQKAVYCGALDYVITPVSNKFVKERIVKLSQKSKTDFLKENIKLPEDLKQKLQKIYLSYEFPSKFNY